MPFTKRFAAISHGCLPGETMSFQDIYGQEIPIAILRNSLRRGRVPHAYLFHGMDGVGKRTTARVLAKALNCRERTDDSCDHCPSCLKIDHGNHPDIVFMEPDGVFIKIEMVRDLRSQIKYRPFEGRVRVFIIDEADRMNAPAANALLKTLEEPSVSNVIILLTANLHDLNQTIRSRCQKIRFNPIRTDVVASFLKEKRSVADDEADELASASWGSIGAAIAMEQGERRALKTELIEILLAARSDRTPRSMVMLSGNLDADKKSLPEKLDILRSWYRDVLVYSETGSREGLLHRDLADATKQMAEDMTTRRILENIETVGRACRAIAQNANKQLTLESMVFKLLR